ncbi:hypothetical protein VTK56DRAFT_9834 [Thermocarpiscus australiensis]
MLRSIPHLRLWASPAHKHLKRPSHSTYHWTSRLLQLPSCRNQEAYPNHQHHPALAACIRYLMHCPRSLTRDYPSRSWGCFRTHSSNASVMHLANRYALSLLIRICAARYKLTQLAQTFAGIQTITTRWDSAMAKVPIEAYIPSESSPARSNN